MNLSKKNVDELLEAGVTEMRSNVATSEQVEEAASRVLHNLKAQHEKLLSSHSVHAELVET